MDYYHTKQYIIHAEFTKVLLVQAVKGKTKKEILLIMSFSC